MRLLLAALPAAACAAALFVCFRMMRHSHDGHAESDELDTLRNQVADLREELARAWLSSSSMTAVAESAPGHPDG